MQQRRQPRTFAHIRREGRYRSRAEAQYARYLEWLCEHKVILEWAYEPRTFWFDKPTRPGLTGVRRGANSYKPDFWVAWPEGRHEWHEVKGWMSARDKTKLARFARYYPEERLVVIDNAQMRALRRQLGSILTGETPGVRLGAMLLPAIEVEPAAHEQAEKDHRHTEDQHEVKKGVLPHRGKRRVITKRPKQDEDADEK